LDFAHGDAEVVRVKGGDWFGALEERELVDEGSEGVAVDCRLVGWRGGCHAGHGHARIAILQESAGESQRWGGEGSERGELLEYGAAGGGQTYLRMSVMVQAGYKSAGTEKGRTLNAGCVLLSLWLICERTVKPRAI
jgi:hypothetical protein